MKENDAGPVLLPNGAILQVSRFSSDVRIGVQHPGPSSQIAWESSLKTDFDRLDICSDISETVPQLQFVCCYFEIWIGVGGERMELEDLSVSMTSQQHTT